MIGNDGIFGAAQALDHKLSLHKVVVQVPGWASVVDAKHLKTVAQSSPELLSLLIKYEQFFLGQVQQTTACNALSLSHLPDLCLRCSPLLTDGAHASMLGQPRCSRKPGF
jgi:hypothetical protein